VVLFRDGALLIHSGDHQLCRKSDVFSSVVEFTSWRWVL